MTTSPTSKATGRAIRLRSEGRRITLGELRKLVATADQAVTLPSGVQAAPLPDDARVTFYHEAEHELIVLQANP